MSKAWKAYENYIAKQFGSRRTTSGIQSSGEKCGDVVSASFVIEVKDAKRIEFTAWWRQTLEEAKAMKKKPMLVFKSPLGDGPLVVMRLRDYLEGVNKNGDGG